MNKLLILIGACLALAGLKAGAQIPQDLFDDLRSVKLEPAPIQFAKKLPVSRVSVLDYRFDTSKLGFGQKGGRYTKLILPGGLQASMQHHLNKSLSGTLDSSATQTLLIIVKNLWLKDVSSYEKKEKNLAVNPSRELMALSDCVSRLELYLCHSDHYIPLFRIDTTYTLKNTLKKNDEQLLTAPFEHALSRFARLDFSKVLEAKQKLSWQEVQDFNKKRFQAPRLAHDVRQRGIYKTYKDFLENKVSEQEFEWEFGKRSDEVYVIENRTKSLLLDLWGFCDGEKVYVRDGLSFFELTRNNHAYEYWASELKAYAREPSNGSGRSSSTTLGAGTLAEHSIYQATKNALILKPKQLNMETGEPW